MEYEDKLDSYSKDLFSKSFKETIDKTKSLFYNHEEYINKPMVKCCVLGNTSSGKSTLINALLGKDILYEGIPEGTLCVGKCQSSLNNKEYFQLYDGNTCLNKKVNIDEVKKINLSNPNYLKFSMNVNNYLDIYLSASNNEILQKFLLIDCPGFNVDNFDAISKYCDYADITVFCFSAEAGITDNDIDKINRIKSKIGNCQISFVINCCDKSDSINRDAIINKLSPHLTGENAIFFISGREEKLRMLNNDARILDNDARKLDNEARKLDNDARILDNEARKLDNEARKLDNEARKLNYDARHREFEKFKVCLLKQKCQAKFTYQKIYLDLICSVKKLFDCLRFTNFREYPFSDNSFTELQEQIKQLINNDTKKYFKEDSYDAFLDYSTQANKEISKFMMKVFINDYNLNEGIIDENYFYKLFFQNNDISRPIFNWYEWGVKNGNFKRCFLQHFTVNLTGIKSDIERFYSERTQICLNELITYKNELNVLIDNINELVF